MMIKRFWGRISEIGRSEGMEPGLARQTSLANQLSLLAQVMFLITFLLNLRVGHYIFAGVQLVFFLGTLTIYWFNYAQLYLRAKTILFLITYLGIVSSAILFGRASAIQLYLIPCMLGAIIVFDKSEKRTAFSLVLGFAFTLLAIELAPLPIGGLLTLSPSQLVSSYQTTLFLVVVSVLAILYVLHRAVEVYENRIATQQAFYQTIMDNIPVSIGVSDSDGRAMFVNKQMVSDPHLRKQIIGKTEVEFRQSLGRDVERGKIRFEKLKLALAQKAAVEFEEVNQLGKHPKFYWSIFTPVSTPVLGETLVIHTRMDISQAKQQAAAFRQKEDLFKAVFDNTADALFLIKGPGTLILDCNLAAVQLFECQSKAELIGSEGNSFQLHPYTEDQQREISLQIVKEGLWSTELEYVTKHGRIITANAAITSIHSCDNKWVAIVRLTDISLQKNVQQVLLRAKGKAEEAVKAKSEFLSRMSHEIRTPLNAIVGLTNLMVQDAGAISQEYIRTIKFSSDALLEIVNDILDFSKLEEDKIAIEHIPFSLSQLLSRAVLTSQVAAQNQGLYLNQSVADQVPDQVVGDPLRLQQILLNLLANAIKFTETGGVELIVEVESREGNMAKIKFLVADSGIGIPDQAKNTIFESFTQANVGISRKFGGTGLGLAIVKRLVELMGGEISVKDRDGGGSIFIFTLTMDFIDQKTKTTPVESTPTSDYDLTGVRVLLAEDNKVNQFVAKQILGKWKVTVDIANNGEEAIAMLRANDYHIILMDVQMPVMDGIKAAQLIRQSDMPEAKRNIPIVALTADIMPDTKTRALEAGMDDIIVKPFELEELYHLLKKLR